MPMYHLPTLFIEFEAIVVYEDLPNSYSLMPPDVSLVPIFSQVFFLILIFIIPASSDENYIVSQPNTIRNIIFLSINTIFLKMESILQSKVSRTNIFIFTEKEDDKWRGKRRRRMKINEFHNMSNRIFPVMEITIEQLYWRSFQEFIQCFH